MRLRTLLSGALLASAAMTWSTRAEAKFSRDYNDPDLDWYTIETEHFAVHYPVSKVTSEEGNDHYINAEYSARKTAKVSEEMWPLMCAELNYFLKERIHVVILDQPDRLEGFTIPSFDWIEISANPGGYFYRMRGRGEWFSDVMIHEFAHVVSLKASNALAEGNQGALIGGLYNDGIRDTSTGVELRPGQGDPWWWTEGGAEFWSDNTGYYVWTSARDANIRMTVLEDRLLTYDEWESRVDANDWGDGERGYQQGFSMALYLRERFGDETMARMAIEYGKGWRPNWETVIEDVLGIDGRTLYEDWRKYITEKYEVQEAAMIADGLVEGYPVDGPKPWQPTTPDARDEWMSESRRDREKKRHATGTWDIEGRVSDDGRWYGKNSRGAIVVEQIGEGGLYAFNEGGAVDPESAQRAGEMSKAYGAEFMHGWDFIPGQDAMVVTTSEARDVGKWHYWTRTGLTTDGYDWKALGIIQLEPHELKDKGRDYESLSNDTVMGREKTQVPLSIIPNTLRATDPAVSPDGQQVAFLQYEDGGLNVGVINMDGSDKRLLTSFTDGTMFQHVDWSPDGQNLVVSIYRNYQNDLVVIPLDGGPIRPLTWDAAESFDPHWAKDGKVYFTSDPDGVFNIYSVDPETMEVLQITNVRGMAECPYITPDGNMVFSMYTGHGWKMYGLPKEQFLNRPATDRFVTAPDMDMVNASLEYREDLSMFESMTTRYRWTKSMMPPTGAPMIRYSNDTMTNWGVSGGFYVFLQDFVENHVVYVSAELGEDSDIAFQYSNQTFHPTLSLFARAGKSKFDFARALDADDDPSTTDDIEIYEAEQVQTYAVVQGALYYPWSSALFVGAGARGVTYGFQTVSDRDFEPFMVNAAAFGFASWSNISARYAGNANPRGGRTVDLNYMRGFTDIVYKGYYGVDVDDGEQLDAYGYNRYEGRWTENWAVRPPWGWDPLGLLGLASDRQHTLVTDVQVGVIDRNVQYNDEFRAGGRHPYFWGDGSIQPNTMFAGYPGGSLGGETMLIAALAYRFPIKTDINKKIGPLYIYDLHGQVMGTAGNLWSYRPPQKAGDYYTNRFDARVAYDPSDIRREIPFVDYSYKNSPVDPVTGQVDKNYLLTDAGAELRLSASMFNRGYWNSFARLAYGFNEIRGAGDVNGDDILSTADNGLGDSLSNETEKPGLRLYIGLGTGW